MSDTNNNKPVWEGSKADAEMFAAQRRACYRTTVYEVVPSELPALDQPSGTIEEFEATLEAEANNPPTIIELPIRKIDGYVQLPAPKPGETLRLTCNSIIGTKNDVIHGVIIESNGFCMVIPGTFVLDEDADATKDSP